MAVAPILEATRLAKYPIYVPFWLSKRSGGRGLHTHIFGVFFGPAFWLSMQSLILPCMNWPNVTETVSLKLTTPNIHCYTTIGPSERIIILDGFRTLKL